MVDTNSLNLFEGVTFDETVTKYEMHAYQPYSSTTFEYNDEIRILIQKQDIYTLPSQSFLYIEGEFKQTETNKVANLTNNSYAFLFSEIRYELNGHEVDRIRNPGYATTLKGLTSLNKSESNVMHMAGWHYDIATATPTLHINSVNACIPLKFLLGFAEDYKKIIINARQELVLLRSRHDNNMYMGDSSTFKLTKIQWHVPHVIVNDNIKLQMYKHMDKDVFIPFRQWELHELPSLRANTNEKWAIRTTSQMEKPRFMIIALQTDKKDQINKNATAFDSAKIRNIQLFLNTNVFPYIKYNLDFEKARYSLAYHDYSNFQKAYYDREADPRISYASYKTNPVFVIDCSKQDEVIKSSTVDVQLELEASENFPDKTSVYCLILHDCLIRYNPTTGDVRRES